MIFSAVKLIITYKGVVLVNIAIRHCYYPKWTTLKHMLISIDLSDTGGVTFRPKCIYVVHIFAFQWCSANKSYIYVKVGCCVLTSPNQCERRGLG